MQARMTYEIANERLGKRDRRKVANNTYLERRDDSTIALRLHATDVVTFRPGTITLDSGGWRTVTTKDRLNYALPVWAKAGTWYVGSDYDRSAAYVYADGVTFTEAGELVGEEAADPSAEAAALKREISKFAKLCADTLADGMNAPSGGDCWFCSMVTAGGVPLGDTSGDHDHLREHMAEGYVVPSMIVNAVVEKGYREPAFIIGYADGRIGGPRAMTSLVRPAVRQYLTRRLVPTQTGSRPWPTGVTT